MKTEEYYITDYGILSNFAPKDEQTEDRKFKRWITRGLDGTWMINERLIENGKVVSWETNPHPQLRRPVKVTKEVILVNKDVNVDEILSRVGFTDENTEVAAFGGAGAAKDSSTDTIILCTYYYEH